MEDYTSNAKKVVKEEKATKPKVVEKIAVGEVIVVKKPLGRKIKDLFIEADFRSVTGYILMDVLVPAAKNMVVDAVGKGVDRMVYGEAAYRRRPFGPGVGPRTTYNSPVSRGYSGIPSHSPRPPMGPREPQRMNRDEFLLSSKQDAINILEGMNDIIEQYGVVSVSDLNDMAGYPTSHIDNKWGWMNLSDVQIRQTREGYLIDLPPAEALQ